MNNLTTVVTPQLDIDTKSNSVIDFRTIRQRAPKTVRIAMDDFLLGVAVDSKSNHKIIAEWRDRLMLELKDIHFEEPKSDGNALAAIDQLKKEFIVLVSQKKQYGELLRFWSLTALLCLVVHGLLGESGLLDICKSTPPFSVIHGHFFGYISFRYAMYGVLIGNALIFSYRRSAPRFDSRYYFNQSLLKRPILNLIIGFVLTYILARLVAEGSLSVQIFGLAITRQFNGSYQPGFRDSSALFILGLAAGIAADIFLQRLVSTARKSAESIFGTAAK